MNINRFEKRETIKLVNKYFIYSILLLSIYVSGFLIFGENTYVLLFDNLDSYVVWHKTLLESGLIFENNLREVTIMTGASRVSLGNELNLMLWLNYIFEPYTAYVVNQILLRFTAFIGFLLLLDRYVFSRELQKYSYLIAILFSLLPFYPNFGIGIAGLPIITYVFLNLRHRIASRFDWFVLIVFPFYSSFQHSMLFYIIFVGLVFMYDLLKRNETKDLFIGLSIFSFLFIIVNYRLFDLFLFTPEFITHRVERGSDSVSLLSAILSSGKHFVLGQYHAHSVHLIFLPFVLSMFLFNGIKKRIDKVFVGLFLVNGVISLIYGFWNYEGVAILKESNEWMSLLNFSRFYYMSPFIWYVLFALSIRYFFENFDYKFKNILILILSFFVFLSIVFKSDFVNEYRTNNITYKEFYSESLFDKIDIFIGKNKDEYKVVSIGIHPAIARYNGFSTLDGYLPIYSLDYKHKFREVIKPELDKSEHYHKKYFDEWGSRFYILSSQLGRNWVNTKDSNSDINIDINTFALYELGGRYIFSANKILNNVDNNIQLVQTFEEMRSPWRIYLYEVSNQNF
ncbi:DUF6044 family protein [Woeseiaceae bacterium]|jgi:hypothetical protein|nr:DUF6044 family protein [Woeseiaceae bacterium]